MRPPGLGGRKALWEPRGLSLPSNSLSLRPWNFSADPPRRGGQPSSGRKQAKALSVQLLRGEAASELAGRARRRRFLLRGGSAWRREGSFLLNSCSSPSLVVRAEQEGLAGVGTEDAATDRRKISFLVLAPHDKPGLQTKTKPPFNRFRRNTPRERCLRAQQSANGGDVQSRRLRGCVGELPKRPPSGGKGVKEASRYKQASPGFSQLFQRSELRRSGFSQRRQRSDFRPRRLCKERTEESGRWHGTPPGDKRERQRTALPSSSFPRGPRALPGELQ